ncbi:DNA repair protein RecN [uncultured Thiothrix sp.]|uniref:DNA repair protein RecN n=1 Tax=uncultured Thiothrix sp. TaxID=223185 RepID=UPI002614BC7F|nr:DNA repair protein RecN [uncultured Thiothrix sp.]
MLTYIHIRDFAIITDLELELHAGMTALTGETGAGKSILLDAIGLVLGDKADTGSVRYGAEKADITLSVDISTTPHAKEWLAEHDLLTDEDTCILRRVVTNTGKSRAWINGSSTTLTALRELGEQLVDIHGQHEHQSLMKRDMQRGMVDAYAANEALLKQTQDAYKQWKNLNERYLQLTTQSAQIQERLDLLSFQVQELTELALEQGEITQLDEELNRLGHAEQLQATAEQGYQQLYENERSLYSSLSQLSQELSRQARVDEALTAPLELVSSAQIQIQEAAWILRDYAQNVDLDPSRLSTVEARIAEIRNMARKYRLEAELLPEHLTRLQTELASLVSDDYDLDTLKAKLEAAEQDYQVAAKTLSKARTQAADQLSSGVSTAMQTLGMQGGQFQIQVSPNEDDLPHAYGMDQIEFLVSANPGQPLKPLTKVASGGELSRISLAIQMIAAQKMTLPALIFDEVDTGIGGGIAEVVGTQLRSLGTNRQVLCVTHLPQVASQAHQHYQVTKVKTADSTSTGIIYLQATERVEEIARMIGGTEITTATRALASEMLERVS